MRGQSNNSNKIKKQDKKRSVWVRFCHVVALMLDFVIFGAMMLTGYAGNVSPLSNNSWWGVFPLAFSIVFWVALTALVLQIIFYRRGALVIALAFICCAGPALTFCPLNFIKPKAPADAERLTLLTYNTRAETLCSEQHPGVAEYILSQDADIVTLQESHYMVSSKAGARERALADSLRARYPNISFGGASGGQMVLSKFPIEQIHLDVTRESFNGGDLSAYRVTLPSGRRIAVFNVHLASFRLANTSLRNAAKNDSNRVLVYDKLLTAAQQRARQLNKIQQWLRLYGGPDVIICGDFNDVQACYTIRSLADVGFVSVYPRIGFGPMITFNDRYLYFCIDHVLTRGSLTPLSLKRGDLKASDHYPLTVEFAL